MLRGNEIAPEAWHLALAVWKNRDDPKLDELLAVDVGNTEEIANALIDAGLGVAIERLQEIGTEPDRETARRLATEALAAMRKPRAVRYTNPFPIQ